MTRIRAGEGCVPSERMVRYYSQRASAGLIITEGTHPSPMGRGYTYPPGLHTKEQAVGLAEGDRCRPRCRGPHLRPTHARRAGVPLVAAAGPRPARRSFGHRRLWGDPHLRRESAVRDAPVPWRRRKSPQSSRSIAGQRSCRSRPGSTVWNSMRRPATFRISFRSRGRTAAPTPTEVRWRGGPALLWK